MQPLLHHHLLLLVLLNCLARSVSETSRSINMKTTQRQDVCDSALELGLALGGSNAGAAPLGGSGIARRPSLTLSLSDDDYGQPKGRAETKHEPGDAELGRTGRASTSPQYSTVSSFSTVACPSSPAVKKGRAIGGEEGEAGRASSRGSDDEDDGGARKKLRLTKEQSALLEDRFKEHSTLNLKQKQALAKQLNLQPRQVEVWFQNRRARTKLKQTEVDCEILKRCCEKLTEENRRLKKELQELKALKFPPPLYLQFPTPTLSMCPSCERIGGGEARDSKVASAGAAAAARPFIVAPKPHFFNPFTRSAAC